MERHGGICPQSKSYLGREQSEKELLERPTMQSDAQEDLRSEICNLKT